MPVVWTQQELDAHNKSLQEISRKAHANDKPARRDEGTIKLDIDRLYDNHEATKRAATRFKNELDYAKKKLEKYKLAEEFWSDESQNHNPVEARQALQELRGGNRYSKAYDRVEHVDGLIESTEAKIADLSKRHTTFAAAEENEEKTLKKRIPELKKELADARSRSSMSAY